MQYALENGIINLSDIGNKKNTMEREQILSNHPNKVWQGDDGYWRTYLPDKVKGLKLKKRKERSKLEDDIVTYYRGNSDKPHKKEYKPRKNIQTPKDTFKDMFEALKIYKKNIENVSDNTINTYESDYNRFFRNTKIEDVSITKWDDENLTDYIIERIKTLGLSKRPMKDMLSYMQNTFERAVRKKLISQNPFSYIDKAVFKRHCIGTKVKSAADRTVSDDQMKRLYARFEYYYERKPKYIPVYAVELATLTGMRVGELAALRWDSIKDSMICINHSEKYNRKTKEYFIDATKNGKDRYFPVTDEIQDVFDRVKATEERYGYLGEFIFQNENGRIHKGIISDCSRNLCIYMGMDAKSIHALRRTVSSKMKCEGIPTPIVASLLGHTEKVNDNNYTYDITNFEHKRQIVEKINGSVKRIS